MDCLIFSSGFCSQHEQQIVRLGSEIFANDPHSINIFQGINWEKVVFPVFTRSINYTVQILLLLGNYSSTDYSNVGLLFKCSPLIDFILSDDIETCVVNFYDEGKLELTKKKNLIAQINKCKKLIISNFPQLTVKNINVLELLSVSNAEDVNLCLGIILHMLTANFVELDQSLKRSVIRILMDILSIDWGLRSGYSGI